MLIEGRPKPRQHRQARRGSELHTDEHSGYDTSPLHPPVKHGAGEYVGANDITSTACPCGRPQARPLRRGTRRR